MAKKRNRNFGKTGQTNGPDSKGAESTFNLASTLYESGAMQNAEIVCQKLLTDHPTHVWGLNLLGVIHCQTGRTPGGIKYIATALKHAPQEAEICNNLGTGLSGLERHADAITAFTRALELKPNYAAAHNNIGAPLKALGRLDEAVTHYREAVRLAPTYGSAWANLANVALDIGDMDTASTAANQAVLHAPDQTNTHNNLGIILHRQGRYHDAEFAFLKALELDPNNTDAQTNLGELLKEQGRVSEAMSHYNHASNSPNINACKKSNRLFALCCLPEISPRDVSHAHREWGATFPSVKRGFITHSRDPERRLRVGYVSSDFRRHSVAYFLEPILANHNTTLFETIAYANMIGRDEVTDRLAGHFSRWRDVVGLNDNELAAQIVKDKIDILVDLSGHTRGNRLEAFALKPAPVQMTYLGYPATSGLTQIDWRITDPIADPNGVTDEYHSERLLRLKKGFLCYLPPRDAPEIRPTPALKNGHITFGSFNNLAKLNEKTIALWAKILYTIPRSRLRLKARALCDMNVRLRIQARFATYGIAENQLDLLDWITRTSPLTAYQDIDIALDTYPYHGTTTTLESLWMGVPVITRVGDWHASRVGASILTHTGLSDLITTDNQEYIQSAKQLASNLNLLNNIRQTMRERLRVGALTDGAKFTKALEAGYRSAWQEWLENA